MIEIRKKEGEHSAGVLYRFTKRVRQSGVMAELRKRRFHKRTKNKRARRISAIFRARKRVEVARLKKLGVS